MTSKVTKLSELMQEQLEIVKTERELKEMVNQINAYLNVLLVRFIFNLIFLIKTHPLFIYLQVEKLQLQSNEIDFSNHKKQRKPGTSSSSSSSVATNTPNTTSNIIPFNEEVNELRQMELNLNVNPSNQEIEEEEEEDDEDEDGDELMVFTINDS